MRAIAIQTGIKACRERQQLRQEDLTQWMRDAGFVWHKAKQSQVENGIWLMSYQELRAMARALDVEPRDLYPVAIIEELVDRPRSLAAM